MRVYVALVVILVALSVCLAIAQPLRLFVAEVTYLLDNGTVSRDYFLLFWDDHCRLDVTPPKDASWMVLRVDSTTPFKPHTIAIDGKIVFPRLNQGIAIIEDFAMVNLTRFETKPKMVSIWFHEYEAKPPVYTVADSLNGKKYWGCLIEALLRNVVHIDDIRVKATIIEEKEIRISSVIGETTFQELVIIVSGDAPEPLVNKLRNDSVELRVTPLYYSDYSINGLRLTFNYVNIPSTCGEHDEYKVTLGIIDGLLNSSLPWPKTSNRTSLSFSCPVKVSAEGWFNYVIQGLIVSKGSKVSISVSTSTGKLIAQAYRNSVLAYDAEIYGFAPLIKLPEFGFRVAVSAVDYKGEPVENLTAVLHSESNAIHDSVPIVKGSCEFDHIPPGKYTVRVFSNGIEVGSGTVTVENSDTYVFIKTSLVDVSIAVIYPNGEKLRNYQLTLNAGEIIRHTYERGGVIRFEDLPPGVYNCTVIREGALLYSGTIKVEWDRNSYVVVANLSKVYIKLVDLLGRPLPNMKIDVKGPIEYSVITGSDGIAYLDLIPGRYVLSVTNLGLSQELNIRSGGEYLTLTVVSSDILLAGCATVLCVAALAITKLRKSRGNSIEVIDFEEDASP
ncbi:MAG: hypothetical protein QXY49_04050 [Thermofilaceae archaeon]